MWPLKILVLMAAVAEMAVVAAWRKLTDVTGAAMCVGMGACSLLGIKGIVCIVVADAVLSHHTTIVSFAERWWGGAAVNKRVTK